MSARRRPVSHDDIVAQPFRPADHRIAYGDAPPQFGLLRVPHGDGPHPVVVMIHGGCWRAENDLHHIEPAADAVTRAGWATWTIEYRRLGDAGGGWPGTFADVCAAIDFVAALSPRYALDARRVVVLGHSAGGHLASWSVARRNLPSSHPLCAAPAVPIRGVVVLAGIGDLREFSVGDAYCNRAACELLAGMAMPTHERYAHANPIELLPCGVPLRLVHGRDDRVVPLAQSQRLLGRALSVGDDVSLDVLDAGHFDLIAPFAPAWAGVERVLRGLLERPS